MWPQKGQYMRRSARGSARVDRESPAELHDLGFHPLDGGLGSFGIQYLDHEVRDLLDFALLEAAGGGGGSADTQAARDHGRPGIIRNGVFVDRDVGAAERGVGI